MAILTIAELNLKHDCYDASEADELWALYEGGKCFDKKLETFLPREPRENDARYSHRKNSAEYRNYIGSVIRHFSDLLFTSKPVAQAFNQDNGEQETDPGPYWNDFREDCDLAGTDADGFFKRVITEAMVKGKSWIIVNQPNDGLGTAINAKDFESRKLGDCWVSGVEYNEVYDWEVDDAGNLDWVLTHSKKVRRNGLGAKRSAVTETWKYYTKDSVDIYQIEYDKERIPDPQTVVPQLDSVPHNFGRCPVVCLHLKDMYQIAAVLRRPALMNFRLVSGQNFSILATCYAQPVAKVADKEEFSAMMIGAGYGIVIGVDEDWGWEAPPTGHFAANEARIMDNKDEIYRLAFQMAMGVENNAAAVGRTAESKSQDAQSTRVALTAYGRAIKQTIELVYDLISGARGDKFDWDIIGLDDFAGIDTAGLVTMAMDIQKSGGIPSPTWNIKFKQKLAESAMPDNDEQSKSLIRTEIEESILSQPDPQEKELELFAAQHAIVAGDSTAGGLLAPQTKPNATKNRGGAKPFGSPKPQKPSIGGNSRTSEFVKAKKPGGK